MKTIFAAALLLMSVSSPAGAGSVTAALNIRATVVASRNGNISLTALPFGTYFTNSPAPVVATATLTVNLPLNAPVTIGFDRGNNGSNAVGTRRAMSDGQGRYLNYDLYQDPNYTLVWGDGAFANLMSATGTGTNQLITIYGRIPAGQAPAIGAGSTVSVSDTLTATVTF